MSCNGCRVLRKGCSEDCVLRPCLEWIKSPESQANATLFLAKFYGRAGLINLINAGPVHLQPEILRSLLFEACGRIIDPVHGSVGLMSSGNWPRVQAAVEAVLQGSSPIICDIRHLAKDSAVTPHRVRTRHCGKRSRSGTDSVSAEFVVIESEAKFTITGWGSGEEDQKDFSDYKRLKSPSQKSGSVETVEPELVKQEENQIVEVKRKGPEGYVTEIELELTLGWNPVLHTYLSTVVEISDGED